LIAIVNTSNEPYEWTHDGFIYGPIAPGQIWEGPDVCAQHALKRSWVLDEEGIPTYQRVELLENVKNDKERFEALIGYKCPFIVSGDCQAKPFTTKDALRKHLEEHFAAAKGDDLDSVLASPNAKKR